MKKVASVKIGEEVIYRNGSDLKVSKKVEKPVDDNVRPKFLIGRTDLENCDYLPDGALVYEDMDEAKKELKKDLENGIKDAEMKKDYYEGLALMLKSKLAKLTD
jgi:hypothetical protein